MVGAGCTKRICCNYQLAAKKKENRNRKLLCIINLQFHSEHDNIIILLFTRKQNTEMLQQ